MEKTNEYIQAKWRAGLLPGIDCILFGDGQIIIANNYLLTDYNSKTSSQHWHPICDTNIGSLEKYNADIWTNVDVFHGAIAYGSGQIVFGDGSMGNEGFVAAINDTGNLIWGIFFTFSNPILKAEIGGRTLICTTELGDRISISLDCLTKISIETRETKNA